MMEVLCGSKNVQKILIFLFVNGKCYGTQVHRALDTPLTPVQKALNRLEKGGLVMSYYEGKTRVYQFNPAYPLLHELEQLLKRAYTLLPSHKKKEYYVAQDELGTSLSHEGLKRRILLAFWEKLVSITQITFQTKTKVKEEKGWNGKGQGEVFIKREASNILIFDEKGVWTNHEGEKSSFRNKFRWALDLNTGVISLEHLRRGEEYPVFLCHLAPSGKGSLLSVDSHLCGEDTYLGQIHFNENKLHLNWRVIGPKKNEEMNYYYS